MYDGSTFYVTRNRGLTICPHSPTAIFLSRSLLNLQHLDRGVIDPTLTDPSFWAAAISESDSEGSVDIAADIAADIMLVELEGRVPEVGQ